MPSSKKHEKGWAPQFFSFSDIPARHQLPVEHAPPSTHCNVPLIGPFMEVNGGFQAVAEKHPDSSRSPGPSYQSMHEWSPPLPH
jgi:hypothetical protein